MSLSPAILDALVASGATVEQIVAVVKADMAEREQALAAKREKDAERQRKCRGRHAESHDVTVTDCDSADPFLDKKLPHTPTKINPIQCPPISPQKFLDAWNEMARKYGLPTISKLIGKRLRALKARVGEHGEEAVLAAIAAVPTSKHWLGENDWLGNFDSLMRPEHCLKFVEAAAAKPAKLTLTADDWVARAEVYERIGMNDNAAECRRKAEAMRSAA